MRGGTGIQTQDCLMAEAFSYPLYWCSANYGSFEYDLHYNWIMQIPPIFCLNEFCLTLSNTTPCLKQSKTNKKTRWSVSFQNRYYETSGKHTDTAGNLSRNLHFFTVVYLVSSFFHLFLLSIPPPSILPYSFLPESPGIQLVWPCYSSHHLHMLFLASSYNAWLQIRSPPP